MAVPSGEPEPGITPKQRVAATVASIELSSPALLPSPGAIASLPATYTCDGKDSWPALEWRGLPPHTAELVLLAMSLKPVEGKIVYDWAVAGLDPGLEGIEAGRLPGGAVIGRNSFGKLGYTICPGEGESERYVFALLALPRKLGVKRGFDPGAVRKAALAISGNGGLMAASYSRD